MHPLDDSPAAALTRATREGDLVGARVAAGRLTALQPGDPKPWIDVALLARRLGDERAEEDALFEALKVDPSDLLALLMRAKLLERQGRMAEAARAYGAAATVAPPLERLAPELQPAVRYAMRFAEAHTRAMADFVDRFLEPHLKDHAGADLDRFRLAVDILLGRKRRHDPQPMRLYYPRLEPVEFFDRRQFAWLDAIEAGTATIRDEFLRVLQADHAAFVPYITYGADEPVAQWAELNHSLRWSVLHLVKDGQVVAANADRCPNTMELWRDTPAPDQPGRTPVALFSLLKPRTRIPPHVGASNVRLLVHLPLIVPPRCGFRVGNTVREWEPGRAWVFDDTIEHEAWNDSPDLRVVMIFDTWHPALSADERRRITALSSALQAFGDAARGDYT